MNAETIFFNDYQAQVERKSASELRRTPLIAFMTGLSFFMVFAIMGLQVRPARARAHRALGARPAGARRPEGSVVCACTVRRRAARCT